MPSFHAGQRLPAGYLNALTSLSADVSGGPTSGTTELVLSGSLVIPAAGIDRLVVPSYHLLVWTDNTNDRVTIRVRSGSGSGTIRAHGLKVLPTVQTDVAFGRGRPFLLEAGTSITLLCTLQRSSGVGVISLGGTPNLRGIAADLYAAP